MLVNINENNNSFGITINKPSLRYLNEFVRLKCGPDLLLSRFFPNAKENNWPI